VLMKVMFEPIRGSKLLRAKCCDCGEPMRITFAHAIDVAQGKADACCEQCSPRQTLDKANVLTPRQAMGLRRTRS
jgi:hypothetical protein